MNSQKAKLSLILSNISGLGPKTIKSLIKSFSVIEEIQSCHIDKLKLILNNKNVQKTIDVINNFFDVETANKKSLHILELSESQGIDVLCSEDDNYPKNLYLAEDSPAILYVKGSKDILNNIYQIAVVGTRNPNKDGLPITERITAKFSNYGFVIVSGLALGIDSAAHKTAINNGAKTIAVMGTNLEEREIYPRKNHDLAKQILETGGCWISELAPGEKAEPKNFALRDRIQSGLCLAIIPVQSDIKGGTMHTVKFAREQGRVILAPKPQEIYSPESRGIDMILNNGTALEIKSKLDYPIIADTLIKFGNQLHKACINYDISHKVNIDLLSASEDPEYKNRENYFLKILDLKPEKATTTKSLDKKSPREKLIEKYISKLEKLMDDIKTQDIIQDVKIQEILKKYTK